MVESAYEFIDICETYDFDQIVLSMKSSNTIVMVEAYRLLSQKMHQRGKRYPIHLGVTEAGDGDEGRIKSAIGVGTLLSDGLGDTIRISLTEDSENEPVVAQKILNILHFEEGTNPLLKQSSIPIDPYTFSRKKNQNCP